MVGCKKHASDLPGMSASINNVPWSATSNYAAVKPNTATGQSVLVISCFDHDALFNTVFSNNRGINFYIINYTYKPGTFNISFDSSSTSYCQAIYYDGPHEGRVISGTITLTKVYSNNVQGTYAGYAIDSNSIPNATYSIKNGSFDINLQ